MPFGQVILPWGGIDAPREPLAPLEPSTPGVPLVCFPCIREYVFGPQNPWGSASGR